LKNAFAMLTCALHPFRSFPHRYLLDTPSHPIDPAWGADYIPAELDLPAQDARVPASDGA
jgi:hypothetical protein